MSRKRVHLTRKLLMCSRMALFELRMLLAALVLKYTWTGVPDKLGNWDDEMEPIDTMTIHPKNGKCVLKLEPRVK
jgi:hypothetical protein